MNTSSIEIGIVIFPGMTQLDVTGPFEVLARLPNARTHMLWKSLEPVTSDVGLTVLPTLTFDDCPKLDVLCVGGGPGMVSFMDDDEVIGFLARSGADARYVTSVCAGSLLLGAAGLLTGYRTACHWLFRDQLAILGAIPDDSRVVVDRNRISGGGVTAGIDFGFQVAAELAGEAVARRLQLFLEYDPQPPFNLDVNNAPPHLVEEIRTMAAASVLARQQSVARARARLDKRLVEAFA
jgi:cyclohexyl-isocyanide hydratase